MPHNIQASYVTKFDDMIKQAYQENGGKIRGSVQSRTGVVGTKHTFNVYGLGFAKAAPTAGADVDTMGTQTSVVECNLSDNQASEYSNIFENDKVNFDDEQELVKVIASALGRKEDQILIDALDAATMVSGNTIPADFEVGGTKTGLTVAKLEEALVALDDQGVPAEGRIVIAPAKAKRDLLASVEVSSADYNQVKPLVNGQVDTFLGFKFIWIGDTFDGSKWYGMHGGGTTSRRAYALHESALCLAVGNLDKETRIDYVPQKMSYLVASPLRAGAVVREAAGVVQIGVELKNSRTRAK